MHLCPPRKRGAPTLPPQQVIVLPLVLESFAFPPVVPSFTGINSAFWFGANTVTVADPDEEGFACETAVTVTSAATLPPPLVDVVGTEFGAWYTPKVEIVPVVAFPPVIPFTSQATAPLGCPLMLAVNCCV